MNFESKKISTYHTSIFNDLLLWLGESGFRFSPKAQVSSFQKEATVITVFKDRKVKITRLCENNDQGYYYLQDVKPGEVDNPTFQALFKKGRLDYKETTIIKRAIVHKIQGGWRVDTYQDKYINKHES